MAPAQRHSERYTRTIKISPVSTSSSCKVSKPVSKGEFSSNLSIALKAKKNSTARFRALKRCFDLDLTTNTIKPRPALSPLPAPELRFSVTGSPELSPLTTAQLDWIYCPSAAWPLLTPVTLTTFTPVNPKNKYTSHTNTQDQLNLDADNSIPKNSVTLNSSTPIDPKKKFTFHTTTQSQLDHFAENSVTLNSFTPSNRNKFTSYTITQNRSDLVAENNIVESKKCRENIAACSLQALVHGKTEIRELGQDEETTAKQYMEAFLTSVISQLADRAESTNSNTVSVTDVVAVLKGIPGWNNYYGFKPVY